MTRILMSNHYFQFKQFRIDQEGAAMKVGTDGVLLGAWARLVGTEKRLLDIGTGTGLIALMMAQRSPEAIIDAIEIEPEAVRQAEKNTASSPWPGRIRVYAMPVQEFARQATERYDHILSNPPFFIRSLKAPDVSRSTARHTDTLSLKDLVAAAGRLLAPEGCLSVIYPVEEGGLFEREANKEGLFCQRKWWVKGTPDAAVKRVLMEYSRRKTDCQTEELVIEQTRQSYTARYMELTKDFYLKF